jgi:hypothetical protein
MSSTLRRFVAPAVLSIVALLLAACGTQGSAPDNPPSASTPAPSASASQTDEPYGTTVGDPVAVHRTNLIEEVEWFKQEGDKIVCAIGDTITVKFGKSTNYQGLTVKAYHDGETGDHVVEYSGEVYDLDTGVIDGLHPFTGGPDAPPAVKSLVFDELDFEDVEFKEVAICGAGK